MSPTSGTTRPVGRAALAARSACARASGSKMWCGSCHDPHRPVQYNDRCLNCHTSTSCIARNRASDDCIGCHMPRTSARTVQHATFTDHTIPRRPVTEHATNVPTDAALKLFGAGTAGKAASVQAGDFKRLGETAYSTGESDLSITNLTAMLRKCARKILTECRSSSRPKIVMSSMLFYRSAEKVSVDCNSGSRTLR